MIKLIAIVGKSGSGKDTIYKKVVNQNTQFHKVIHITTRPKRDGEIEGVDYFFRTEQEIDTLTKQKKIFCNLSFNDWSYALSRDCFDENHINILISNPYELLFLMGQKDFEIKVFEIVAKDKTRLMRSLDRDEKNVDEIVRRYIADQQDFSNKAYKDIEKFELINEKPMDVRTASKVITVMGSLL